ncbi:site-specific DNA-methyltransferase [Dinghuibacter silviterrae]|uniref:site-specific DNA-methyltransferase (adenine-specific) n=1 Tax=Dinghuibacter silviterrae TaxID=1539049 RepID=A0A4R8DG30_9BACT|nr:site-specific DNA-methyltransferase [Dinghuibacter silviterrae]TDW96573.1 adenine-specific DNA-methyltransferase [Dinghuibacter silviterrae]
MPTLNWIGKDKVINHHMDVPYKVLEHSYGFDNGLQSETETKSGNKIIHGDNLEALKSLLPEYEGRIKCIYIDPPYNTGTENWVYNDNVNDPRLKKWLKKVVGTEGEDLSRHDKWCCMMYPRLVLLHKLLADDGAIFVSIDDNEQATLKLLMDEIWGTGNFIGKVSWFKKRKGSYLSKEFVSLTEYIYAYRKKKKLLLFGGKPNSEESQPLVKRTNATGELKFPAGAVKTKLKEGEYRAGKYGSGTSAVHLKTDITVAEGVITNEFIIEAPFIWSQSFLDNELQNETQLVINTLNLQPRAFRNSDDKHKGFPSFLDGREFSATTDDAYETLRELFGTDRIFDYSKPYQLVSYLINSITYFDNEAIVLDSFAGSGTTGHAVLDLNKKDEGKRKFILVQVDETDKNGAFNNIAETTTAERVRRVIKGGITGGFDFYELGEPLFNEDGGFNESVGVEKIRNYIFYTETQKALESGASEDNHYFLDKINETAYYFHYETGGVTTLNHQFLSTIKTRAEQYVIYADKCLLTKDFMTRNNIVFKKIPRDITRF